MIGVEFLLAGYTTYNIYTRFDNIDYLAFIRYSIIWILPTITLVTSLAYLLQVIFNNGIVPIIVQFAYWFYSISFSNNQYGLTKYIIRYNVISSNTDYQKVARQIMINRGVILAISMLISVLSVWIFEKKRGNICG
jgi:hypothetical protein